MRKVYIGKLKNTAHGFLGEYVIFEKLGDKLISKPVRLFEMNEGYEVDDRHPQTGEKIKVLKYRSRFELRTDEIFSGIAEVELGESAFTYQMLVEEGSHLYQSYVSQVDTIAPAPKKVPNRKQRRSVPKKKKGKKK